MKTLLNISTHGSDPKIFNDNWHNAQKFLLKGQFDGFELYPTMDYPLSKIPSEIVVGIHLRFFAIIESIWQEDNEKLLEIFDNLDTVRHFYGGTNKYAILDFYKKQFEQAHKFGAEYVVFHPVHCELEYVHNWNFPWTWQSTVDLSAEIINEITKDTDYDGLILFENLWWPGNFRLDSPQEIERLLDKVNYQKSGIVLDTGHVLNKNQSICNEAEGVNYILETIKNLGDLKSTIKAVHLNKSLSAEYVTETKKLKNPYKDATSFWERFSIARKHVGNIDQHEAFEKGNIRALFDILSPEYLVFEFTFRNMMEWKQKIDIQRKALKVIPITKLVQTT